MSIMTSTIRAGYKIAKPILFKIDPEAVHTRAMSHAEFLGTSRFAKKILGLLLKNNAEIYRQTLAGIDFRNPIGLAAGFDYEARLTQLLESAGFGFQTIGTITNGPYEGNTRPMLGRLPKSLSLMVNKGFKNSGASAVARKLAGYTFPIPLGVSIGSTNSLNLKTQAQSIADICAAFKIFEASGARHTHYELNISCPNLKGTITFYPPKNLDELLSAIDTLKISRPIFIKMPIEKSADEVVQMLDIILKHKITGIIIGNLQKDRANSTLQTDEVSKFPTGNFSGKPTFTASNEFISLAYKHAGDRLVIIGCGGVFSAEDAYEKIKCGATLVQLITGLIFEGPQLVAEINQKLPTLLQTDSFTHISQAIGSNHRPT